MSEYRHILHFVFNPQSGRGRGNEIFRQVQELAKAYSWEVQGHEILDPKLIEQVMKNAADLAFKDQGTLAAAGGDGTLRAAVQAIGGRNIRFAAVPGGTFNLFARAHHIPEEIDAALKLIFEGTVKPIRVGEINKQVFLINANLGLYAKAINDRKAQTKRWGRHRIVAILSTLVSLLKGHPNMKVRLCLDGKKQDMKTPMIFIGNNALQLKRFELEAAEGMKEDRLAVFTMKPFRTWDMLRILFRGMAKTLDQDPSLESFNIETMSIEVHKKHSKVCLDGEMFRLSPPFEVRALPEHVLLVTSS